MLLPRRTTIADIPRCTEMVLELMPYAQCGGWDVNVDSDEEIMVMT
jgi:hypothetical protein